VSFGPVHHRFVYFFGESIHELRWPVRPEEIPPDVEYVCFERSPWDTPDLLAEEGIEYVCDWCNDDQPYPMKVKQGSLVSIPYTLELNDIPVMVIQHHASEAWVRRCKDQFDRLHAEGARNPRVMALAVHPYISGVPHRIKYFEAVYDYMRKQKGVWFTTGEEIYEWWKTTKP